MDFDDGMLPLGLEEGNVCTKSLLTFDGDRLWLLYGLPHVRDGSG